ncbi:MAG: DUF4249 domain-containing protein [Bacteroidota bacterium]
MKKYLYTIIISITFLSCEDVIDVELDTAPPRLVVEASINWFKGTVGDTQAITLTTTTSFYNEDVPPASGATVTIIDEMGNTFNFTENGATGIYENNAFLPVIDREYTLTIIYQGETYTATETLKSVTTLESVEQNDAGGFTGESTEIKIYYTDPASEKNYYFFKFESPYSNDLDVYDDKFFNGNQIFALFFEEDFVPGDEVTIQSFGISQSYYNYMFTLLSNLGEGGFESQPATVKGNIVNQTNPDNFAFGYFRLSEADEFTYVIE